MTPPRDQIDLPDLSNIRCRTLNDSESVKVLKFFNRLKSQSLTSFDLDAVARWKPFSLKAIASTGPE